MSETATKDATQTREAFLVAYFMSAEYGQPCSWCDSPGVVRIEATTAKLADYACEDHAAGHMRGNADAIAEEG